MYKDIAMLFVLVSSKTARSIINLGIWHGFFSEFTSFVKWWRIIFFGPMSLIVGFIWPYKHCTFAKLKGCTFTNFFLSLDPCPMEGPIKSLLSVCLSVYPSVHPSIRLSIHLSVRWQKWLNSFFLFLARWYLIGISKNWLSSFFQENLFLPKFEDSKWTKNRIF